jgi:hypothetical protein
MARTTLPLLCAALALVACTPQTSVCTLPLFPLEFSGNTVFGNVGESAEVYVKLPEADACTGASGVGLSVVLPNGTQVLADALGRVPNRKEAFRLELPIAGTYTVTAFSGPRGQTIAGQFLALTHLPATDELTIPKACSSVARLSNGWLCDTTILGADFSVRETLGAGWATTVDDSNVIWFVSTAWSVKRLVWNGVSIQSVAELKLPNTDGPEWHFANPNPPALHVATDELLMGGVARATYFLRIAFDSAGRLNATASSSFPVELEGVGAFARTKSHVVTTATPNGYTCWFRVTPSGLELDSIPGTSNGCFRDPQTLLAVSGTTLWMGDHTKLERQGSRLWQFELLDGTSFRISAESTVPYQLAAAGHALIPPSVPLLVAVPNHDVPSDTTDWATPVATSTGFELRAGGNIPIHARLGASRAFTWITDSKKGTTTVLVPRG